MEIRKAPLTDALPDEFAFYHLGQVRSRETETPDASPESELTGVAFDLLGGSPGVIVVLFDKDLDFPTYTEMGNVLASRIADRLSRQNGVATLISPPRKLDPARIPALLARGRTAGDGSVASRDYTHFHKDRMFLVRTMILPAPSEGAAYA